MSSELFKEILECTSYLHDRDVIRRDLKPPNILLSDETNKRSVKIADFGLAIIHEFDDQTHTDCLGSSKYVAPEVMRGRTYNKKPDIFSLGVIAE
jgi:serine/threonine protein kinase